MVSNNPWHSFDDDNYVFDSSLMPFPSSQSERKIENPEAWCSEWEEELLTLYHSLKDQCSHMGINNVILDTCDFHAFVVFAHQNSTKYAPSHK
jgi:hypothetical protein